LSCLSLALSYCQPAPPSSSEELTLSNTNSTAAWSAEDSEGQAINPGPAGRISRIRDPAFSQRPREGLPPTAYGSYSYSSPLSIDRTIEPHILAPMRPLSQPSLAMPSSNRYQGRPRPLPRENSFYISSPDQNKNKLVAAGILESDSLDIRFKKHLAYTRNQVQIAAAERAAAGDPATSRSNTQVLSAAPASIPSANAPEGPPAGSEDEDEDPSRSSRKRKISGTDCKTDSGPAQKRTRRDSTSSH
jgi:hypothetical protein